MSNDCSINEKGRPQIPHRASFSLKMQQSLEKMKRSIQKITESSATVQPQYVFVENSQDDEKQSPYVFPDRLSSLTAETGFSRDEIRKMYRAFKQHCPRGAVTTSDLKPAYAKLFPLGDSWRYTQIVFNSFDKDGDGIVGFGDLLAGIAPIVHGDADQKLSWIFRFYDLNGDGRVTRREMLAVVSAVYEMVHNGQTIQRTVKRHVDRFFEKMDTDKDGVISKEEFMSGCKNDSTIHNQLLLFNALW